NEHYLHFIRIRPSQKYMKLFCKPKKTHTGQRIDTRRQRRADARQAGEQGMLAAIELGGTKVICQLADTSGDRIAEFRFPTETPERTLKTLGQRIVDALPPGKTI